MGTWDDTSPAQADNIAADLTAIRGKFDVIKTAWKGDHVEFATDGADSTDHKKVTLVEGTEPAADDAGGIIWNKSADGELYYRYKNGSAYNSAKLTNNGSLTGGAIADLYWTAGGIISSNNVVSVRDNSVITPSPNPTLYVYFNYGVVAAGLYSVIANIKKSDGDGSFWSVTRVNDVNLGLTISSITVDATAVVTTSADHGLVTNDAVYFDNIAVGSMTQLNEKNRTVTYIDATSFSIGSTAGYDPFVAGAGDIYKPNHITITNIRSTYQSGDNTVKARTSNGSVNIVNLACYS